MPSHPGVQQAPTSRIRTTVLFALSLASACCAAVPAALTLLNLREYREPPTAAEQLPAVTVIVPARNEEAAIGACVESVLQSTGIPLHVLVLNDASTDATATVVERLARRDRRLRLEVSTVLPPGWNGKQHACWLGAQAAETPLLCFIDADVRVEPKALARMATLLVRGDGRLVAAGSQVPRGGAALVSGFPWEQTGTPLEWLLLPLIHFVLLGLLPMRLLRTTTLPGFGAGCGQFLLVEREAYFRAGGHAAIHNSMHDGVKLPRLLRAHGEATRLADLTTLARCRMYTSAAATWNGLVKNATEGLGSPGAILPATLLLGLGQVLPLPLLAVAAVRWLAANAATHDSAAEIRRRVYGPLTLAACAVVFSYLPRVLQARRFRQKRRSAVLHPIGVATLLALQWVALGRKVLGRPATWKARSYKVST